MKQQTWDTSAILPLGFLQKSFEFVSSKLKKIFGGLTGWRKSWGASKLKKILGGFQVEGNIKRGFQVKEDAGGLCWNLIWNGSVWTSKWCKNGSSTEFHSANTHLKLWCATLYNSSILYHSPVNLEMQYCEYKCLRMLVNKFYFTQLIWKKETFMWEVITYI